MAEPKKPADDDKIEDLLSQLQGIFGRLSTSEDEESKQKLDVPASEAAPAPPAPPPPLEEPAPTPEPEPAPVQHRYEPPPAESEPSAPVETPVEPPPAVPEPVFAEPYPEPEPPAATIPSYEPPSFEPPEADDLPPPVEAVDPPAPEITEPPPAPAPAEPLPVAPPAADPEIVAPSPVPVEPVAAAAEAASEGEAPKSNAFNPDATPTAIFFPTGRDTEAKNLAEKLQIMTPKFTKVTFRLQVQWQESYDPKSDWKEKILTKVEQNGIRALFMIVDRAMDDVKRRALVPELESRQVYFHEVPVLAIEKKAFYTDLLLGLVFFFDSYKSNNPE
jgi:hypothetical protein